MFAAALDAFGKVDAVLNVAGIGSGGRLEDATVEEYQRIMAVNLLGVMLGTKHGIRTMVPTGGGAIVNWSSTGGMNGSKTPVCDLLRVEGGRDLVHEAGRDRVRAEGHPRQRHLPRPDRHGALRWPRGDREVPAARRRRADAAGRGARGGRRARVLPRLRSRTVPHRAPSSRSTAASRRPRPDATVPVRLHRRRVVQAGRSCSSRHAHGRSARLLDLRSGGPLRAAARAAWSPDRRSPTRPRRCASRRRCWPRTSESPRCWRRSSPPSTCCPKGRLQVGLGAGWLRQEYEDAGMRFETGIRPHRAPRGDRDHPEGPVHRRAVQLLRRALHRDGAARSTPAGATAATTDHDRRRRQEGARRRRTPGRHRAAHAQQSRRWTSLDPSQFSAPAIEEKIGWIRDAAGESHSTRSSSAHSCSSAR